MPDNLTCIHSPPGSGRLCEDCQRDYDADPSAWVEFGDHEEGLQRWRLLQKELDRDAEEERKALERFVVEDEIPF